MRVKTNKKKKQGLSDNAKRNLKIAGAVGAGIGAAALVATPGGRKLLSKSGKVLAKGARKTVRVAKDAPSKAKNTYTHLESNRKPKIREAHSLIDYQNGDRIMEYRKGFKGRKIRHVTWSGSADGYHKIVGESAVGVQVSQIGDREITDLVQFNKRGRKIVTRMIGPAY